MDYKVTEVETLESLPEELTEVDHISQFILRNTQPLVKEKELVKEVHQLTRVAATDVVTCKINDTKVWVKLQEWEHWDALFQKNPSRIDTTYVNGTTEEFRDGYQLYLSYQL